MRNKEYKKWHLVGFSYPHWITTHGHPHIRFTRIPFHYLPTKEIFLSVTGGDGSWSLDHPHQPALRRQSTCLHSFFPAADVTCHVATVAPFVSYDVAIMQLFRVMTKRKNADQMNHLPQDVGRAYYRVWDVLTTGCRTCEDDDVNFNLQKSV